MFGTKKVYEKVPEKVQDDTQKQVGSESVKPQKPQRPQKPAPEKDSFVVKEPTLKPISSPVLESSSRPLESLLTQEKSLKEGRHLGDYALGIISSSDAINDATQKTADQNKVLLGAQKALEGKRNELNRAKRDLDQISSQIRSDSKIPQAQTAYNEATSELGKFYLVRSMDEDQKKDEAGFIKGKLQSLQNELNATGTSDSRKSEIKKQMNDLEGWVKSLLADPFDDTPLSDEATFDLFQLMMLVQAATGANVEDEEFAESEDEEFGESEDETTYMGSTASTSTTPMPLTSSPIGTTSSTATTATPLAPDTSDHLVELKNDIHESSKALFGDDQMAGAATLAKKMPAQLSYNANKADVADGALLKKLSDRAAVLGKYVLELKPAIDRTADKDVKSSLESALRTYEHELTLLNSVFAGKKTLDGLASQTDRALIEKRNSADQVVQTLKTQVEQYEVEHDKQARLQNLRDYQTLSSTLTSLSDKMRTLAKTKKDAEVELKKPELKTPMVTEHLKKQIEDATKNIAELDIAFLTVMHRLEVFDNQKTLERKGDDPYPSNANLEGMSNWVKGLVTTTGAEMPSKAELMRQYHLAKNGLDGVTGAYVASAQSAAKTLYDAAASKDASKLMGELSLERLKNVMGEFKDFAMKNPILSRELAANLMHTYAILAADGTNATSDLLNSARAVLQRKTAENITSDMLLGAREHLYSTEGSQNLTPEQIAFFDLAEKAPYIAAAYIGAQGKNLGGRWAQTVASYIPFIGSHGAVQALAGAAGGTAEVKAQKAAAEKISRDQEVLANSILTGFNAVGRGEGIAGAIKQAAAYGLVREALRGAGTFVRDVHEDGSMLEVAKTRVRKYAQKWTTKPGEEAAKLGAAGAVGTGAGVAAGIGVIGATTVAAAPLALAIATAVGATVGGRALIGRAMDWMNPQRVVERTKLDNTERLKNAANNLPTIVQQELAKEGTAAESQQASAAVVKKAVERLQPKDYDEAASKNTPQEQTQFLLEKIDEQVEKLNRERQFEIADAMPEAPDPELDELKQRLNALKQPGIQKAQMKSTIAAMEKALPPKDLEDDVDKELRNRLEKLRSADVLTPNDLQDLEADIKTKRVRQLEANVIGDEELENRFLALSLPNVPTSVQGFKKQVSV